MYQKCVKKYKYIKKHLFYISNFKKVCFFFFLIMKNILKINYEN